MKIFTVNRLFRSLLIVAAVFLLDATGRLTQWVEEYTDDGSNIARESIFDTGLLNLYESNVVYKGQNLTGFTSRYRGCSAWEVIKAEGVPDVLDLSKAADIALFKFTSQCPDGDLEDVVTVRDIFRWERHKYATFEIDLPNKIFDKTSLKDSYFWRENWFSVGKLRFDITDEKVRRGLQELEGDWFRASATSGFMELSLLYQTGNDISRLLIKLFTIFSTLASTCMALSIAIAMIMQAGAKKDKRFKTGYKDNRTPDQIANQALELTQWLMIYGLLNLILSAPFFVLVVLAIGSLDPTVIFGLSVFYIGFLALGWGIPISGVIATTVGLLGIG